VFSNRLNRFFICSLSAIVFALLLSAVADAQTGPPPIPPVISATDIGTVQQNPVIYGRDGTFSTLFQGKSVWTFGDTVLSVPGREGKFWDDNSLSWTTYVNASNGITLEHDLLDNTGAPVEFLPYTQAELKYNRDHDSNNCRKDPCGAEFAMWGGPVVADPVRNRLLFFYDELWRVPGKGGWTNVGMGIAVGTPGGKVTRPIENPDSPTPTLMWGAKDVGYGCGSMVVGDTVYSYACVLDFLTQHYRVARVKLADILDITKWTYYAGNNNWSTNPGDAANVFDGGAAGSSVFYNAYLGNYMAIYSGIFSDDIYYRVSYTPWGPWSDQALAFTGRKGYNGTTSYAGMAHSEFAQGNGQTQFVTYAHTTGLFRMDEPIEQVVFGKANK